MDLPTLDYASARDHMVDSQVRPDRIVDPRIIRAMRTLPRERFVPASQAKGGIWARQRAERALDPDLNK